MYSSLIRLRVAGLAMVALMASPVWAQSAGAGSVQNWTQQLAELELRLKTLRADDRQALDRTAADLHELDVQVSRWLSDRSLTIDAPPALSTRLAELTVELSRVRALVAQTRAGSDDDSSGAGVFYLGRVDVAVSGQAATPGLTEVDGSDLRWLDAKTVTEAAEVAPGVSLHRVGPRNEGMLYIRGFDLRQVPLFIDGIPSTCRTTATSTSIGSSPMTSPKCASPRG